MKTLLSIIFVFVFSFVGFASDAKAECSYSILLLDSQNRPTNMQFTATAQSGIIRIKPSEQDCPPNYSISSDDWWITITQSSTDPNVYFYLVEQNPEDATRIGAILISTPTLRGSLVVSQQSKSCTYSISSLLQTFSSSGGTGQFDIQTLAGCGYWALSDSDFLIVTNGMQGTGNKTLSYSVAANKGAARTGTITVGGQTVTITQAASKSRKRVRFF